MLQFDLKVKEVNEKGEVVSISDSLPIKNLESIIPSEVLKDTIKQVESQELTAEPLKKRDRQGQINFTVPDDIKISWKVFCDKSHITLKQGLTCAMEYLIREVEDGEVILTVGGVMKKRKI